MFGEYGRWVRTSQQSCNSFCLVIKETCSLAVSWWKIMHFLLTNSRCFLSSAFSCSKRKQYLLELIGFPEGAHSRGLPSNPTTYTTSPLLDEDQRSLWFSWWWFISLAPWSLPFQNYCTVSTFHCPSQLALKIELFHFFSVENHMWKYSQGFYSLMWNPNTKVINITKQV